MDEETEAQLHEVLHTPGFELPRAAVLRGDVIALRQLPALPGVLAFLEDALERSFDGVNLEQIHAHFDFDEMKIRAERACDRLVDDLRVPAAMQAVIGDLGLDPRKVLWEWPGMCLLYPVEQVGAVSIARQIRARSPPTGAPGMAHPSIN